MVFWLLGAYALFYLNVIFDTFGNVKEKQMKNSHVHLHMLCVHKVVSRKIDLSFGLLKKTNFGAKNKIFYGTCFVFFIPATYNVVFCKTLRTHMDYRDIHMKFFV
jgi:hypothetical protein